jgi:hypothetical protein
MSVIDCFSISGKICVLRINVKIWYPSMQTQEKGEEPANLKNHLGGRE